MGLVIGLVLAVIVVITKLPFLVNTPRSAHPLLLLMLVGLPTVAGALCGLFWPRLVRRA